MFSSPRYNIHHRMIQVFKFGPNSGSKINVGFQLCSLHAEISSKFSESNSDIVKCRWWNLYISWNDSLRHVAHELLDYLPGHSFTKQRISHHQWTTEPFSGAPFIPNHGTIACSNLIYVPVECSRFQFSEHSMTAPVLLQYNSELQFSFNMGQPMSTTIRTLG